MVLGIALGLAAAACQSTSYIFSRRFSEKYRGGAIHLLVISHLIMGLFSLVLLAGFWPAEWPLPSEFIHFSIFNALFYFLGQGCLFLALKNTGASRISPLLGLKILILAFIGTVFMDHQYLWEQWAAVVLSVTAALLLRRSGSAIPLSGLAWILAACVFYCLSDINIKFLMDQFEYLGLFRAACVSTSLSFAGCGLFSLVLLPFIPKTRTGMRKHALPFAVAWFAAMLFLYACFSLIGFLYGNIVQSTRGLISILFGWYIARAGYTHIEEKTTRRVFWRRVGAGLLMVISIILFNTFQM